MFSLIFVIFAGISDDLAVGIPPNILISMNTEKESHTALRTGVVS